MSEITHISSEDEHYDFCVKHDLPHLHFICTLELQRKTTDIENLKQLNMSMIESMKIIAHSNLQNVEYLKKFLPPGISEYGLIDCVAIGDITFGPEALYKLGYRACPSKEPRSISNEKCSLCRMSFNHPSQPNRNIYYEDFNGHDMCKLWYCMNELNKNTIS